jgi:hypothetical protein
MHTLPGFSAAMYDLLEPDQQRQLINFIDIFFKSVGEKTPMEKIHAPISASLPEYIPAETGQVRKKEGYRIVLLTDATDRDTNLNRMIEVFVKRLPNPVEIVNLNDVDIRGGCQGCSRCCLDGKCAYKDGFRRLYDEKLFPAKAIVMAGSIRDRFLSSTWKIFWDRSFYHGHKFVLHNKQRGYIISGPLRQNPNLRQALEAYSETRNLAGFVTDEYADSSLITSLLDRFGQRLLWSIEQRVKKPPTFLGVSVAKIFRDTVYETRFVMRDDHKYYKKHKLYNFPNRDPGIWLLNMIFNLFLVFPPIKRSFFNNSKTGMLRRFKKVFNE